MRPLYDWILRLSERPRAVVALFLLSLAESSFFPIPPDVMLVPMCVAKPKKAFYYAFWCSVASIIGGVLGYLIGTFAWDALGQFFFEHIPGFTTEKFEKVGGWYEQYNFWVVFMAGFSPIPYKLITITAGVFAINFPIFLLASAISRSGRFFLEAWLVHRYGKPAQTFIEKNFNLVSIAFVVLLVGGFLLVGKL
jgi:membrane protein YqaA with SNARE-associated domain